MPFGKKLTRNQNSLIYRKTFRNAEQKLIFLSADPEIRDLHEEREKALSDERSRLSTAEEKGMLKIVKSFLDSGMPIEEVVKHTPYSADELKSY